MALLTVLRVLISALVFNTIYGKNYNNISKIDVGGTEKDRVFWNNADM